jgi:hypothetical protein
MHLKTELLKSTAAAQIQDLRPLVVTVSVARKLLGDKSRSEIYEAIGRNDLEALKDGAKTLISVLSIERYLAALPAAKIKRQRQNVERQRRELQTDPAAE